MLIVEVKNGETIDRALRRYKRKFISTGLLKELRSRKDFKKKSVVKRHEKLAAVYKEKRRREME